MFIPVTTEQFDSFVKSIAVRGVWIGLPLRCYRVLTIAGRAVARIKYTDSSLKTVLYHEVIN